TGQRRARRHAAASRERVEVVVRLRRLGERDLRVAEVAEQVRKEVLERRVVGVEEGDELAGGAGQGGVDVAGLRAARVGARAVVDAELAAEGTDGLAAAVVE